MSIHAMAEVFSLDLEASLKWLLMCLADHADEFGRNCYPSVAKLAQKSSMTERTVQRNLRLLEEKGYIAPAAPASAHRGVSYRLRFMTQQMPEAPRPNASSCPKALRLEVIEAFAHTCVYCEGVGDATDGPDGQAWHVDRIRPGSRGGSYSPENVTLSCGTCNRKKKGAILAPHQTPLSLAARVPSNASRGAIQRGNGVPAVAPEPSIEPSFNRQSARARNIEAANWKPTVELLEWAATDYPNVDLVTETDKFIDHFSANGKPMKNWNAAWRNWIRRAPQFNKAVTG